MSFNSETFIDQWLDDRDYVIAHTSGSTGRPKAIRLFKNDMIVSARATNEFFGLHRGSKIVLPLSEDYIAGKMMIVRALLSHAHIISEPPSRSPLSERLPYSVDLVAIVPQQIRGLISSPCAIRNVIVGGGPIPSDDEKLALSARPDIRWWATYGMTETCSHVALRAFGEDWFSALPGISFSLDGGKCLVITNQAASWSPVVTNDIVDLRDARSFRWLGRVDNVIISGGLKIHPEIVEKAFEKVMGSRNFYIVGRPSEAWGTECVLKIEGERDFDLETAIQEVIRGLIPHHRPKSIEFVPSFQYTSSGKIIRK
ncbi:MAG: AMP-binding protein [Paramuribaculum sp.]|nr:AMP-binding protein [Paramuribaculum sp.]